MAEEKKKVSELDLLSALTGQEFVEVIARDTTGVLKNYRVLSEKLCVGASAFDSAVKNGFTGTEAEWLQSLVGKSAYQTAVDNGYEGTEAQWVAATDPLFEIVPENAGMILTVNEIGLPEWKVIDLSFANLDKVDNTPDLEKPVSRPQQRALDRKLNTKDVSSEVMKVLVGLGAVVSADGQYVSFDEGRVGSDSNMIFQHKRGSTAEAAVHKGEEGSFFIDLELKKMYLHDGVTVGGALVGGLTANEVQEIVNAALEIEKIEGLSEVLTKKADLGDDGKIVPEQLPEMTVPTKVEDAVVIEGLDNEGFITAQGLHALLTAIGFTKDDQGAWKLDAGVVTP